MTMRTWMTMAPVLILALGLTACGGNTGNPNAHTAVPEPGGVVPVEVAVIDLDAVAVQMGWVEDINHKSGSYEQGLQTKFDGLRQQTAMALRQAESDLGANPTAEQKQHYAAIQAGAQRQLTEANNLMQQQINAYRQSLVQKYHELVNPWVQNVAIRRGCRVVLYPQGQIFWADPSCDITMAVVEELKKNQVKMEVPTPESLAATAPATAPAPTLPLDVPATAPAPAPAP